MEKVSGYIVLRKALVPGHSPVALARKGVRGAHWITHPRLAECYVHTERELRWVLEIGRADWLVEAVQAFPAQYNPETTFAEEFGSPIEFSALADRLRAPAEAS